ncbi:hypothetical protein TEA_012644 [Camellia sinensis var. sinensis]|uniref:Uncharacterized protein n=1 Tax=Camellia sinensis var. sinensis TaxID=542762 RepID=A0A4S4DH10_CAMSN|nr:hypothetical protein TEA_012644 [Camellia sinensis var. sinensis]
MDNNLGARTDDPFLVKYNATDLRIASEFLSNWLPFLSTDLCLQCTQTLSDRIRSLAPEIDGDVEPIKQEENSAVLTSKDMDLNEIDENHDNCNTNSLGSWKDAADLNDTADTNSLGSWKDEASGWSDPAAEASSSETVGSAVVTSGSPRVRMSWADMAQEDELEEEEEENEVNGQPVNRKKDFICLERFKGKIVNILEGLELHTGVFSAAEQKRIVDFVYSLQERGKKGELKGQSIQPTASPSNSDVMLVKCF